MDNQQQTSISKSNQLFIEEDSSKNKETAVSFTNKSVNEIDIEVLKRKIDTITRYQNPYISKMLNKLLLEIPINVKTKIAERII